MKGNSSCHIPNDKYRANYDLVFKKVGRVSSEGRAQNNVITHKQPGVRDLASSNVDGGYPCNEGM